MGSRGRKSAAALSLTDLEPGKRRPEPPADLSPEAKIHWQSIVDSMPADWFPAETHAMLKQLCRQIVRSNVIAQTLDGLKNANHKNFRSLLRIEMQLSNSIIQLSTKMRISQQSSYDRTRLKTKNPKKEIPWEAAEAA